MQAKTRRGLSMARRALQYASANPIDNAAFAAAVQRLEAAVAKADNLAAQEATGQSGHHSGIAQRRVARRAIREKFLVPLARIGEQAAQQDSGLIGVFALQGFNQPSRTFLIGARERLAQLTAHAGIMTPLGITDTFAKEFAAALDQYESIGAAIDRGRGQHIGSSKGFGPAVAECRMTVGILDALYRAGDVTPEVLGGWQRARRIEGPFTHHRDAGDAPNDPSAPEGSGGTDAKAA